MQSDLHHLPERQQRELERVSDILLAGSKPPGAAVAVARRNGVAAGGC